MTYQKSEKCYYIGLKPIVEWNVPSLTYSKADDRYNKLLKRNLRQKSYQRAKDNNIKRWLDLLDMIQNESPLDYIRRKAFEYENGEFEIKEIFVQSSTTPAHPKAAPQKCYLIGIKNIVKAKSYENLVNELGRTRAIGALMILDFNLIFELMFLGNKAIEQVVIDIDYNVDHFVNRIMDYWSKKIANNKNFKDISTSAFGNQEFEIITTEEIQNDSASIESDNSELMTTAD